MGVEAWILDMIRDIKNNEYLLIVGLIESHTIIFYERDYIRADTEYLMADTEYLHRYIRYLAGYLEI